MYVELWLLVTALIFTIVGYSMGKGAGTTRGIEMTLEVLIHMKLIKFKRLPNGEEEIVAYNEKL
jgi:hypothetical protein